VKEDWLRDTDANTKTFHASTSMKRRRNRIKRLVNDVGVEFEDEGGMENMVLDYFHQLFIDGLNPKFFQQF